jgi:uncharacterized protein YndB with AHSA1/START domain
MIYVTVERLVRRRPEIVWEHLTDVTALTAWAEGVVDAKIQGDEPRGEGTRVDVLWRNGRTRHAATVEVTAWRPPSLLALETRVPGLLLLDRFTLARVPEGTALGVYGEIVTGNRLAELFARPYGLLGGPPGDESLHGIYDRSVEALVKRIESMSTVPYR